MHIRLLIIFLILFVSTHSFSQNQKVFDSLFAVTSREIYSAPEKTFQTVEELLEMADDDQKRIQVLLLRAENLRMLGGHQEAINTLLIVDSIADKVASPQQKLMINGMLASNYRENNLPSMGIRHLEVAKEIVNNIEDPNLRIIYQNNISQEMVLLLRGDKKYKEAIEELRYGISLIDQMDTLNINRNLSLAVNYELLGQNFIHLEQLDSALVNYDKAMDYLNLSNSPNVSLRGSIYSGFGKIYLDLKEYDKAIENIKRAEEIAEETNVYFLKKAVYKDLVSYYKEFGDDDNYIKYNEAYLQLEKEQEDRKKEVTNNLLNILYNKSTIDDSEIESSALNPYVIISGIVGVIAILFFSLRSYRKKNQEVKEEDLPNEEATKSIKKTVDSDTTPKEDYLPEETVDSIYEQLLELEKTQFYLDKDLSLSVTAAKLGINSRYLSYVIKQKTDKDFISYINDLRVGYAVDYLKADPKHLNYKISYLAEESGFSSHNRFSINFKKVMGISPSEFIQELRKQNEITEG